MSSFNLPKLTRWHQSKMLQHAEQVLTTQQQMQTHSGKNIIHYTLQKKRKHIQMDHYPKGDRIDKITGGQYFYHCHRENHEQDEHGHFHCFMRQNRIPKTIKPTPLPDWDLYQKNPLVHLIGISMNRLGQPIRLFTTNRWVTAETWHDATYAPRLIKRFKMTLTDDPHWQVLDQWVEGILHLFAPQIIWLHNERDAVIAQHQQQNPDDNVYINRTLEELSSISVDLKNQINWVLNG